MSTEKKERCYLCIDMKSFYASVECAERSLDPFETNLVVADISRGKNALCLAISPKMKKLGIRNRCRLSEIPSSVKYITAPPRMSLYVEYAADIYSIYLDYFDAEDIHVYSIDESFIDVTEYLPVMHTNAFELAKKLMREISRRTGVPSTSGIGTNLYLAKIALDITAKHSKDHMGYLDEALYRSTLWDHIPITDFWQIAGGRARRLQKHGITTMRGIAEAPEEIIYKCFGKDAELIIDHAWGRESCLMSDIKKYRSKSKSVSFSQILPRNYTRDEAKIIIKEMALNGCHELMKRGLISGRIELIIGYSGEASPPSHGGISIGNAVNISSIITAHTLELYEKTVIPDMPIRRIGIVFSDIYDESLEAYDLFTDISLIEKEKRREQAVLDIKRKYGKNSILRGTNFIRCATQRERNEMIGGHRAGYDDKRRES